MIKNNWPTIRITAEEKVECPYCGEKNIPIVVEYFNTSTSECIVCGKKIVSRWEHRLITEKQES